MNMAFLSTNFDSIANEAERFINEFASQFWNADPRSVYWHIGRVNAAGGLARSMGAYELEKEFENYFKSLNAMANAIENQEA
jgi:hypothetical protein